MGVPSLKINLMSLLKKTESDPRRRNAFAPILRLDAVKREIGMRVIDAIIDRTLAGKDKNGKPFDKYSKEYKKSLMFRIYKGGETRPNLKLTGDMQNAIDVMKITDTGVEINFNDDLEGSKAEGHVYGRGTLKGHKRNFWGLPDDKTMETIMKEAIKSQNLELESILAQQLEIPEITVNVPTEEGNEEVEYLEMING